jgi:hypothetical protein
VAEKGIVAVVCITHDVIVYTCSMCGQKTQHFDDIDAEKSWFEFSCQCGAVRKVNLNKVVSTLPKSEARVLNVDEIKGRCDEGNSLTET